MKNFFRAILAAALLAGPMAANAAIIDTTGGTPEVTNGWAASAQTFIAPTDDVLQSWTLFLAPRSDGGNVQLSIYEWSSVPSGEHPYIYGSGPIGAALFTTTLDWSVGGGAAGTSGMNLQLTSGVLYGVVIDLLGYTGESIIFTTGPYYEGGNGFWTHTPPFGDYTGFRYSDHHFIAEFSSSISVPEPGSLALLGLGLVGMGYSRRRKAA